MSIKAGTMATTCKQTRPELAGPGLGGIDPSVAEVTHA